MLIEVPLENPHEIPNDFPPLPYC